MTYSPGKRVNTVTITVTGSLLSIQPETHFAGQALGASAVWPAANRAIYVPVYLPSAGTVTKFWWLNGATVGNGGASIGLYAQDGTLVVRDATGQTTSGASVLQYYDATDTFVSPGTYYLALALQSASDTVIRNALPSAAVAAAIGMAQEASAYPLPATATPVVSTASTLPIFGMSFRTIVSSP